MIPCMRTLTASELPKYRDHLLRLDEEDRRLRFGFPISDEAIQGHVRKIDMTKDRILVQVDDDLQIIAAAHIAAGAQGTVELAFSVDSGWRGNGLGTQLFERALLWARNRGIRHAVIYFLFDNHTMRHLARQVGMSHPHRGGRGRGKAGARAADASQLSARARDRAAGDVRTLVQGQPAGSPAIAGPAGGLKPRGRTGLGRIRLHRRGWASTCQLSALPPGI